METVRGGGGVVGPICVWERGKGREEWGERDGKRERDGEGERERERRGGGEGGGGGGGGVREGERETMSCEEHTH